MFHTCFLILGVLCLVNSQWITEMLNTKSPYPERPSTAPHEVIDPVECPNGKLIHFNAVIRHGSRQPTAGDVEKFNQLQEILQTNWKYIGNPNFMWMKDWKNPFHLDQAGLLNVQGEIEHYNMSKRILDRYSPHFYDEYTPVIYPIRTTAVNRAARSGNSFGYGLYEGRGVVGPNKFQPFSTISDTPSQDITLRFFDNCPRYTEEIVNNKTWTSDSKQYIAQYSKIILQKVIQKLNVDTANWPMEWSDVALFIRACTFEAATDIHYNHFCALFDKEDVYRFETSNDLSDYWIKGYGNAINYKMSCPLLIDFWASITDAAKGLTPEKSKLRFGHAETIIPFVSLLGLFKDDFALHWDSPQIDDRKWKTSIISPYAANIAMGLYNCSGEYKIKLLHNEVEVPVPGCGGMYCPMAQFATIYAESLKCNFTSICALPPKWN